MRQLHIVQVNRDKSNVIKSYNVIDENGVVTEISSSDLKKYIKSGEFLVHGYKLTKDNRLINVGLSQVLLQDRVDNYLLMNKDVVIAKISRNGATSKFSNGALPYGYNTSLDWVNSRVKFSCARDVKSFFSQIGLLSIDDLINVTHCVSLSDTYWIKSENDTNLHWKDVSPFRRDYSRVISAYALEGRVVGLNDKNYFSPVLSTDGLFPHTWKYNNGEITFIKAGSKYTLGGSNSGKEPISEYYAYVVASYLGFNCIEYSLRNHRRIDGGTELVTECKCYTSEDVGSISAHKLFITSYEDLCEYAEKLGCLDDCVNMLFLDCLLLNTDRHFGNVEFFIDNDSQAVRGIVPIFDNNYSLLPRFIEGYDEFNRSDYVARDGRTFKDLYKLVRRYKKYNKELIKLRNFRFTKVHSVDIKDSRIEFFNWFLQEQVKWLLSLG